MRRNTAFTLSTGLSIDECKKRLECTTDEPPDILERMFWNFHGRRRREAGIDCNFCDNRFWLRVTKRPGSSIVLECALAAAPQGGSSVSCKMRNGMLWRTLAAVLFMVLLSFVQDKHNGGSLVHPVSRAQFHQLLGVLAFFWGYILLILFIPYVRDRSDAQRLLDFLKATVQATDNRQP